MWLVNLLGRIWDQLNSMHGTRAKLNFNSEHHVMVHNIQHTQLASTNQTLYRKWTWQWSVDSNVVYGYLYVFSMQNIVRLVSELPPPAPTPLVRPTNLQILATPLLCWSFPWYLNVVIFHTLCFLDLVAYTKWRLITSGNWVYVLDMVRNSSTNHVRVHSEAILTNGFIIFTWME